MPFIGLGLRYSKQTKKNRKQRVEITCIVSCPRSGLSRAYFGDPSADLVHHLLVITQDPLLDFVIPVCAKPHDRILARAHNKKRHHLACSQRSSNQGGEWINVRLCMRGRGEKKGG